SPSKPPKSPQNFVNAGPHPFPTDAGLVRGNRRLPPEHFLSPSRSAATEHLLDDMRISPCSYQFVLCWISSPILGSRQSTYLRSDFTQTRSLPLRLDNSQESSSRVVQLFRSHRRNAHFVRLSKKLRQRSLRP